MNLEINKTGSSGDHELLKAQAHIWKHIYNFMNSMALKCAVELGIPETIRNHNVRNSNKPMSLSHLISALQLNPNRTNSIYRIMRLLVHSGFFLIQKPDKKTNGENQDKEEEEEEGYVLTSSSLLLLKDNPMSLSPLLLSMLDPNLVEPWHYLSTWLKTDHDPTPFDTTHGMSLWDHLSAKPKLNYSFNEGMAKDSSVVISILLDKHKAIFEGLDSLLDVGGGKGGMTREIAKAFPQMKCTVLDLPQVVSGLEGTENFNYVAGDMFEFIPPANAILMKAIMHDWNDEECVRILKKCKKAITTDAIRNNGAGKVVIIDFLLECKKEELDHDSIETQLFYDLLMMALCGGKERTEKDFAKLFYDAGFSGYKIIPVLGLRSVIEIYP